jgi:hypothetical protein
LHRRSDANSELVTLPIGHWQDITVENGVISAIPFFSDKDEFAMQIYHKVEEGTIRMASAGLLPFEVSDAPELMKEGQELPTLIKSEMFEASICDIGVNNNALTLYNKQGATITLSDNTPKATAELIVSLLPNTIINSNNMNPQLLALAIMLGLGKDATEIQLAEKMTANHAELLKLQKDSVELALAKKDLETKLAALELATATKAVEDMLTLAVNDGKITEAQKPEFATLAMGNLESVKNLLDKMPKHTSAETRLAAETGKDAGDPLLKLSYDDLHKSGKLATVKDKYPDHYKTLHAAKYPKK